MPLDNDTIAYGFRKYRNLIIAGTLFLVLVIGAVMAFTNWFGNWLDWGEIEDINKNINAVNVNNNAIRDNLNGLSIDNAVQEKEVERLGENFNAAKNATDESRNRIREAERNVNAVRDRDFRNTNMTDAQKARCEFNPRAEGCPPR